MAHVPRWPRRKKDVAPPTLITTDLSGNNNNSSPSSNKLAAAVAAPAESQPAAAPAPVPSPGQVRSSLHKLKGVFHRSAKRARDSPPASLPHSPAAAPVSVATGNGNGNSNGGNSNGNLNVNVSEIRPVSPLSLKTDAASTMEKATKTPKMPAFLDLPKQEIENRFSEIVWRERHRMMQSLTNPSPDFRWARVTGPHLKLLDRYVNIQPWNNNRVKLRVPEGKLDYINASPIILHPRAARDGSTKEPSRYIAMQGPKQITTDHVWRMVVEQLESPGVIVMLTETHEGAIEKCYPYFPRSPDDPPLEVNERDEFGDGFRATVKCEAIEETPAGDAIELRKLVITVHPKREIPLEGIDGDDDVKMKSPQALQERSASSTPSSATPITTSSATTPINPSTPALPTANLISAPISQPATPQEPTPRTAFDSSAPVDQRIVYHFLYKKWPDFGVPSLSDLDSFFTLMRLSREKNSSPSNPRIVHCSAGVGRSGTFIALEYLMGELERGILEGWDDRVEELKQRDRSGNQQGDGEGAGGMQSALPPDYAREDLVFEVVDALREQRRTMVQAEAQYEFIYRVLRKFWVEKYGPPEEEEIDGQDESTGDGKGNAGGSGGCGGCGDEEQMEGEGARDGEPAAKRLVVDRS